MESALTNSRVAFSERKALQYVSGVVYGRCDSVLLAIEIQNRKVGPKEPLFYEDISSEIKGDFMDMGVQLMLERKEYRSLHIMSVFGPNSNDLKQRRQMGILGTQI